MPEATWGARQALLTSLRRLSDDELVARLKGLAARERRATALLVAHLAELETRDVYLRAGYSSLFTYCRDVLALSEHEAYNRIEAARTARRFPVVLDLLAAGEVNLTTVRLLGPHLAPENHVGVLESARGKRKAEVEEIVARLSPRPEAAASVRKLPEPKAAALGGGTLEPAASVTPMGAAAPSPASAEVAPLSPDRYRYQLTIGGSTLEKLRLAKDMLRHALPSGDDEAILDRALIALLEDLARRKFGARQKPGSSGKASSGKGHRLHPVASEHRFHVMSPRRSSGRYGCATSDGALSWARTAAAAASAPSWSFTTSGRTRWAAKPASRTSNSDAVATTATRRVCTSIGRRSVRDRVVPEPALRREWPARARGRGLFVPERVGRIATSVRAEPCRGRRAERNRPSPRTLAPGTGTPRACRLKLNAPLLRATSRVARRTPRSRSSDAADRRDTRP